MAKSDSFFIRATVDVSSTGFNQTAIDLGAYVDALGKSVLRVHNAQFSLPQGGSVTGPAPFQALLQYQITTQSQTAVVGLDNKSVVASGKMIGSYPVNTQAPEGYYDTLDVGPQHWTNGYLIGVEQIYLGANSTDGFAETGNEMSVVLECTVETLSQSAAMALALSQQ